MTRLFNLKPSIKQLAPRLGYPTGDAKAGDRYRASTQPWRQWYKTARWLKLRQKVLLRDCYTCQRTGVVCYQKHPSPFSPVVDHIKAHKGDPALFWDEDNLQVLSKQYHDSLKQAEDQPRH